PRRARARRLGLELGAEEDGLPPVESGDRQPDSRARGALRRHPVRRERGRRAQRVGRRLDRAPGAGARPPVRTPARVTIASVVLAIALAASVVVSVTIGSANLTVGEVWGSIVSHLPGTESSL